MGDVINLRQARKVRRRCEDQKRADANRLAFGRTKAEKAAALAEQRRLDAAVDGARLDAPEDRGD